MSDAVGKEMSGQEIEYVKLGDITKVIRGASPRPKGSPEYFGGSIPWIMIADVTRANGKYITSTRDSVTEAGAEKSRYLKKGTLILSNSGTVCVPKILGFDGCIHDGFVAFPEISSDYDKEFLYHYFNYIRPRMINENRQGITQVNLNTTIVKNIDVPVFKLEQQKRIVAKIEELFSHINAGIEALKKAKQLLKQYRQAVLKAAVTGELTKEWREANKAKLEPASQLLERILKERRLKWEEQQLEQFKAKGKMPKDDKWKEKYKEPLGYSYEGQLPEVPDSWLWVSPEQIASTDDYALAIGPFGSNLKVSDYRDEGVPLVFVRNIRAHDYSTTNAKYVTNKKAEELRAHSISGGDVLITKMGEPPGDASIYPCTAPDAIITADCIKWRFSNLIKTSELFVHIINSQVIKNQILSRTKGVAQKKISLGTFKSVAFPLPPLEEQAEILRELDQKFYASDRLLKELDMQLLKTERSKQSVLASAFSGMLRE
ncbi:MAG: restriction endonuclease subunit S [Candidatus Thiodiazotropha sp.]